MDRAALKSLSTFGNRDNTMKIDIGISEADRATIADGLSRLLADTYVREPSTADT